MRKFIILTLLLFAGFITINAQDVTIRVAGGYAGPGFQNDETVLGPAINPATPTVDALVPMANINDSAKSYKQTHGSYGSGGNATLAVGYMFTRFFGIDLGIGYAHSNDISCVQTRQLTAGVPIYINANINSFSYAVALSPSLVITAAKTKWKVYPYARIGIVLPVAGTLTDNVNIFAPIPAGTAASPGPLNNEAAGWLGRNTQVQLVTKADISVGITGAFGVAYRPLPFMNIFVEGLGQYLNVRAKSSKITKWTADGVSDLPTSANPGGTATTRSVYRTQIVYVDQLTAQSNNVQYNTNYNASQPKQDTRPIVPGSNLGFNVGVTFFLSKKTLRKQDKSANATKKD